MVEGIIANKNHTIFYSCHNEKQRFGKEFMQGETATHYEP
jgi:hypothetical protein